jgi:hypothetical protein
MLHTHRFNPLHLLPALLLAAPIAFVGPAWAEESPDFSVNLEAPVMISVPLCEEGMEGCDPDFDDPLTLVPHRHDFGRVAAGGEGASQIFALVNDSEEALAIGGVAISGEGIMVCQAIGCPTVAAESFYILSDACSGVTLPPAESCEVEVVFQPLTSGPVVAHLLVPYQAADGTALEVAGKLRGSDDSGDNVFAVSGRVYAISKSPGAGKVITPVAGLEVRLSNDMVATTDEFGEYRFENLVPGRYKVTPVSEDYRLRPRSRNAVISKKDRLGMDFQAAAK